MSYISDLKRGTKNSRDSVFPGTEKPIKIRVLSCAESQACGVAAEKWMEQQKDVKYSTFNAAMFNDENSIQVLFLALSTPEGQPIADDVHEFRANLTEPQLEALLTEYNSLQDECAPEVALMTQTGFDEIVADIKKKPVETIGKLSNTFLLKKLLLIMVDQDQSSPTDSG